MLSKKEQDQIIDESINETLDEHLPPLTSEQKEKLKSALASVAIAHDRSILVYRLFELALMAIVVGIIFYLGYITGAK